MKKTGIVLLLLILSTYTFSIELDINQAVEKAFESNREIKKSEKDLENYKLQVKEAVKEGLPSIVYTGYAKRYEDLQNTDENSDKAYYNNIKITQPLFTGGLVLTGIKASGKAASLAEFQLVQKKKDVRIEIIEDYVSTLKLIKNQKILLSSLEELKINYNKLEEMYKLNLITKTTLLEMNYTLINLESSLIEIENAIEISKLNLKNSLDIDSDEALLLKDVKSEVINPSDLNYNLDYDNAIENNLNIKMIEIKTMLTKDSEKIDRANLLPKVNLTFDYGNAQSNPQYEFSDSINSENLTYTTSLNFSMTLFDWGKNLNKFKRAKNNTVKQELDEKTNINNLKLLFKQRYLELSRLYKLFLAMTEALESSKENFSLEKERFNVGIISSTDFLAAENRYRQSQVDFESNKLDFYVAYEKYIDFINKNN